MSGFNGVSERSARRFRVVVASPGDVASERDHVDTVAAELNGLLEVLDIPTRVDVIRWEKVLD